MEQLTKNQAVATSQEAVQNQNEPQLRDENAHNDKSVHGVLKSDMDLAAKGLGAKEWNNSLKTKLSLLPKKLFRIRMRRNFWMKMLTITNLNTVCLSQIWTLLLKV